MSLIFKEENDLIELVCNELYSFFLFILSAHSTQPLFLEFFSLLFYSRIDGVGEWVADRSSTDFQQSCPEGRSPNVVALLVELFFFFFFKEILLLRPPPRQREL